MTVANQPATQTLVLKPIGAVLADGSQLFEVVQPAVQAWMANINYAIGVQVTGSDGKVYIAKSATKNVNPVTDSAVHWLNLW